MIRNFSIAILFFFSIIQSVSSKSFISTPLQSAIVMDATSGTILYQHQANALTYPASLTKMMTLMLLFDAIDTKKVTMATRLPVSAFAAKQAPTKLGLKAGETISVKEALMGLITKSANDAAVAIAEKLGGTEEAFARMMTFKARNLGMRNTTFKNASGLPHKNQRTTAWDMALLSKSLIKNYKRHYPLFKETSFTYKGKIYKNHNKLLDKIPGMDGIKTGFVNASGFNLAASCVRNNHRIIAVVMGGRTAQARDKLMTHLINTSYQPTQQPNTMDELVQLTMAALPDTPTLLPRKPALPTVKPAIYQPTTGHWMIQVGSYKTIKQAEKAAAVSYMSLAAVYDASVKVSKNPQRKRLPYRAYLQGFNKNSATQACRILTKAKKSCLVVAPQHAPRFYVAMN